MTRPRRVLYASDFRSASPRAFETALMLAKTLKARLTIVSVVPSAVSVPEQYIDAAMWDRLDTQIRRWCTQATARLAVRAKKAAVATSVMLREGDPADQIIRACRASRSDIIVLGTRGRRGFPRVFLGSVATRVVTSASCPVVTVRNR